jgi:hypothetical protein
MLRTVPRQPGWLLDKDQGIATFCRSKGFPVNRSKIAAAATASPAGSGQIDLSVDSRSLFDTVSAAPFTDCARYRLGIGSGIIRAEKLP